MHGQHQPPPPDGPTHAASQPPTGANPYTAPQPNRPASLARNVGSFFGHIVSAVKADVRKPPGQMAVRSVPQPVSRPDHVATAERLEQDASGNWVLRRITIETVGLPGMPPVSFRPVNPLPPIDQRQLPPTTR